MTEQSARIYKEWMEKSREGSLAYAVSRQYAESFVAALHEEVRERSIRDDSTPSLQETLQDARDRQPTRPRPSCWVLSPSETESLLKIVKKYKNSDRND